MHNAVLKYLDIDWVYLALPCKNEDFDIVINALKKLNCKGINITIPFKEKVFELCSEITPIAKKVGAINTLKLNSKGEWIGTNTDVEGFISPLKKYNLAGKESIVLGSGGAARAVLQGLINLNFSKISIISRNNNSLKKLMSDFESDGNIKGFLADEINSLDMIDKPDLIINTTPVGMENFAISQDLLPFGNGFWKGIQSHTIVYDLIYNPSHTSLLKYSQSKGCTIIGGKEMLIAQGAKSLSYWTNGLKIPIEVMNEALDKHMQNSIH